MPSFWSTDSFDPLASLERALSAGRQEPHSAARRYSIAIGISAAAVAVIWLLQASLGHTVFLVAACAILVNVRINRSVGASLLVTVVTLAATDFLLLAPIGSFRIASAGDVVRMIATFLAMVIGILTNERLSRERTASARQRDVMQRVLETGLAPVLIFSRELKLVFVNGPAERMFGLERPVAGATSYPTPVVRTLDEAGRAIAPAELIVVQALQSGKAQFNVRRQVVLPDGTSRTFIVNAAPLVDSNHGVLAVVATLTDITEQIDATSALQESADRLKRISEVMPGTYFRFRVNADRKYSFDFVSDNFRTVIGVAPEIACADFGAVWRAIHPDDQALLEAGIESAVRDRTPWGDEFRILTPDDTIHWVRGVARPEPLRADDSLVWHGVFFDVTQEKHLEQSLLQAQKMESIGRLAGGIAHDFNNILTAIRGHVEIALESTPPEDERHEDLREVRLAADRAATLTRQLLAFSRKQQLQLSEFSLHGLLCGLERMLRRVISEDIELALRADASSGTVRADPGQIEQVVMNLVVNAHDAMPKGGRLILHTSDVTLSDDQAASLRVAPGRYVQLAVEDTGHGMDATTRARLFEPFFTTKPVGQGTGLGLATAYGIVHQCGGAIRVESAPDQGSTFRVLLPRFEAAPVPAVQCSIPRHPTTNHKLRVLLVEDEPMVRSLASRMLKSVGCDVAEAANGRKALEWIEAHGMDFDVLLTDVVMPEMKGSELARELVEHHPSLRVVFMSGYIDFDVSLLDLPDASVTLLSKPFSRDELLAAVLSPATSEMASSA